MKPKFKVGTLVIEKGRYQEPHYIKEVPTDGSRLYTLATGSIFGVELTRTDKVHENSLRRYYEKRSEK